jgi:hypothetical protein
LDAAASGPTQPTGIPATGLHDRRLDSLYRYWSYRRDGRRHCRRADIDPVELRDLLGWMAVVEVSRVPELKFRYRVFGTQLANRVGFDLTGHDCADCPLDHLRGRQIAVFQQLVERDEPMLGHFQVTLDTQVLEVEALMLPLGDNDQVDHLLVGVRVLRTTPILFLTQSPGYLEVGALAPA